MAMRHTMVVVETSLPAEGTINEYRRSRPGRRRSQASARAEGMEGRMMNRRSINLLSPGEADDKFWLRG
jgi:hypothetical protein